jgi:hypothetical protein
MTNSRFCVNISIRSKYYYIYRINEGSVDDRRLTLSSREFNQAASEVRTGPVFITDRGRPAHVLM